ncbi:MAG: cell division protein FtsL, partial [Nitrospirae bacterium]|nr:cell division protein FtsL [Nitrospirota bacterium]
MIRGKGMALVIVGVLVLAFFYVGQRTYVVQLGYDLEALKGEKKRLEQVHNHLVIEAAALGSLDRVERIA